MIVGLVGAETFGNYDKIIETLFKITSIEEINQIVSDGTYGVDHLAERFTIDYSIPITICPPEWYLYGKMAGYMRNRLIVENSDLIVIFWDEQSKETKNVIDLALNMNKRVEIVPTNFKL
jgi:hypothetical protein